MELTGSKLRSEYNKAVYCLSVYLSYMQSTSCKMLGLDESQAINKIAGRNINNLRYPDDNTVMTESEEKLKNPLMRVKHEWKSWLTLNIKNKTKQKQKPKIMAPGPIT